MGALPRLSKSLLEKPQLIEMSAFKAIAEVLSTETRLSATTAPTQQPSVTTAPYGVLKVEGATTYKPTGYEALCGGCSYVDLIAQMEAFAAQGKKQVVMWIDSPGGESYRCFYTAAKLRKIADDHGIRLIAYVDGSSCSAAYALSSSCHEVISNPNSSTGSIGVVISLTNNSKQLEKEGIQRTFITAGESKVPFADNGEFKEGFLADLQESVDDLYTKFVSHVATARGITEQTVRNTQAKVFNAEKSLNLGLVDKVLEEDDFWEYLEASATPIATTFKPSPKKKPIGKVSATATPVTTESHNLNKPDVFVDIRTRYNLDTVKTKAETVEPEEDTRNLADIVKKKLKQRNGK